MTSFSEIDQVYETHEQWKRQFKAVIDSKIVFFGEPVDSIRRDDQCDFGKWLNGPAHTHEEKMSYHYIAVKELHTEFHFVAAYVVVLALAGKKAEALKAISEGGEYAVLSEKLAHAVMQWRDSLKNPESAFRRSSAAMA